MWFSAYEIGWRHRVAWRPINRHAGAAETGSITWLEATRSTARLTTALIGAAVDSPSGLSVTLVARNQPAAIRPTCAIGKPV